MAGRITGRVSKQTQRYVPEPSTNKPKTTKKKPAAQKKAQPKAATATRSKGASSKGASSGVAKKQQQPRKTMRKAQRVADLDLSQLAADSAFFRPRLYQQNTGLGNLNARSAPIHPIFHSSSFVSNTTVYATLKPSLRLASKFLGSHQLRKMIALMWHARNSLEVLGDEVDDQDNALHRYTIDQVEITDSDEPVDDGVASADIDAILEELSECVNFNEPRKAARKDRHTTVTKVQPGKHDMSRFQYFKSGVRGTIWYNTDVYQDLFQATATPVASSDIPNLLVLRFQFAVTLVHEVMHALQNAIYGDIETDPFHGEDQAAETGFKAEWILLNGNFDILYDSRSPLNGTDFKSALLPGDAESDLVGVPLMWKWPCRCTIMKYLDDKAALCVRRGWEERVNEKDIAWRVLPADLECYFTREYWAATTDRAARDGLFLPEHTGHAFRPRDQRGSPIAGNLEDEEERRTGGNYVFAGYEYDEAGHDIVREQEEQEREDEQ